MNRLIWDFRLRRLTCLTYPESDPGNDIVQCAQLGRLSNPVLITLKPIYCQTCKQWFPDTIARCAYDKSVHEPEVRTSFHLDPRKMSVSQLRD